VEGHAEFEITPRKDGRVQVRLKLIPELAKKLDRFLCEKGFRVSDAAPVLIEYGLNSLDEGALKELGGERERELPKLETNYAVVRFQAYQCFMINQAIVMRLHILLSENRRLKKLCMAEGMMGAAMVKDAWESWGAAEVDSFYKRYVFVNSI
jgi:hypothetical protein